MIRYAGKEIQIEHFPNNEIRIRNVEYEDNGLVELKYESSDDLIALMFLKQSIDEKNLTSDLYIRYMPYSRMDREFKEDLFLLKYMTTIINTLNFRKVFVLEPHSSVTDKLLNNVVVIKPMKKLIELVKNDIGFRLNDHIVFPDNGAYERYQDDGILNPIQFSKKRDEATTLINKLYRESGTVNKGSKCIIVDDVCSTGSTALGAAEILKKEGADEVYVLAAHTENQVIDNPILGPASAVDRIYTTDSLITKRHVKVKVLPYSFKEELR